MKLDWKNIAGAAFFAAALLGSGLATAAETNSTQNMVCSCARVAFNSPNCQALKEQVYGTGGVNNANPAHGAGAMMPQNAATPAPVQAPTI